MTSCSKCAQRSRAMISGPGNAVHRHLFQGVTALRLRRNRNCVMCRGESRAFSRYPPPPFIQNPRGRVWRSGHFHGVSRAVSDDLEVRWLLNLSHMTLGEHPRRSIPRFLISLERFSQVGFEHRQIRDIGAVVGLNRFNQAGGGLWKTSTNDCCWISPSPVGTPPHRWRSTGIRERDVRKPYCAGWHRGPTGRLYCVQTDTTTTANMDIFIPRGAWIAVSDAAHAAAQRRKTAHSPTSRSRLACSTGQLHHGLLGRLR